MPMNSPEYIHLIFKTHLDIGFTDLAKNVVEQYFTHYIPKALTTAKQLRENGDSERFIWTVGSWLIYEYLEQATTDARATMEQAIAAGEIVWHGLPFTTHSELLDESLFTYGLSLSQQLDRRFGKKTIAAKMTDVPGHTRGIVPLLAHAGIRFLHIGVNPASTAPHVPPTFVWRDTASATEIIVMYQAGSYGDFASVAGLQTALAFAHTNDNLGPQSRTEVLAVYRQLRAQFPQTTIAASTLDAFAQEIWGIKETLPLITEEIGDTWIHGAGTDPQKVGRFRTLSRLRRKWLDEGRITVDEHRIDRMSNALLLVAEHTWGLDEKENLNNYTDYTPAQLHALRQEERTRAFEASWQEQRDYVEQALQAVRGSQEEVEANKQLADLLPHAAKREDFASLEDQAYSIETRHFTLEIDSQHGALISLVSKATGRVWASKAHPLALFHYECFAQADYERFWRQYASPGALNDPEIASWGRKDLTKPGIELAVQQHQSWRPSVSFIGRRQDEQGEHLLVEMHMPPESTSHYGAPSHLTLEINAPHAEPILHLTFQWFDKQANRLPEALWLSFSPEIRDEHGWYLEKLGTWVAPEDVIAGGNRKLHAVGRGIRYQDDTSLCFIETLDAPLVAPGEPSLLDFNDQQPAMRKGIHVNLFNNVWGTNFPMWNDENARFRFTLRFSV